MCLHKRSLAIANQKAVFQEKTTARTSCRKQVLHSVYNSSEYVRFSLKPFHATFGLSPQAIFIVKATMSTSETILVVAECLCKAHNFSTEVLISTLPLLASACHCNSCRRSTGALYSIDLPWPEPRRNVNTTKLRRYAFSGNISILFCGICSTPLFFESTYEPHALGVFTGALKNSNIDLVKINDHIFVGDTIDGGATMWLRNPNTDGSEAQRFEKRKDSMAYPHDWPPTSTFTEFEKTLAVEYVPIRCHCNGVDLMLHHGNYRDKKPEELPWFVDPKTRKLIAGFDVCNSCRLQSGIDIFHWTFCELESIFPVTTLQNQSKSFPKTTPKLRAAVDGHDLSIGTLAYYQSSSDVQRYFCKVCSATVFYAVDDRPEIVDVAVGLLDAPDGARAEGILSWAFGETFSWVKETKGGWREGFMKRAQEEAENWRIKRGYPKNWRRVEVEENERKKGEE